MSENLPSRKWLQVWPWLAAALTGVLTVLCFAPFEQTWICWIALTPLLAAVWFSGEGTKRRWLRDLFLGYLAGVIFFWGVFSWLHTVTVPGMVIVGLYMGVYFALWAWLAGLLRPRKPLPAPPPRSNAWPTSQPNDSPPEARSPWLNSFRNLGLALVLASGWVALEWVRSWMFSGWGWNGLGVPLHDVLPIIQIAEITGVAGLSFIVAFSNVIGVATVRRFTIESRIRVRRPHYDFTLTLAAIVGLCGYGLRQLQMPAETEPLQIAAVQANIPRDEKFSPEFQSKIFAQFERLTHVGLATQPPPQLIIWPESSTPAPALLEQSNYRFVMDLAASIKTDLLLGTIDADEGGDYNAALLVSAGGEKIQVYRKLHLVPFGEYVPGRHTVPFISSIVGDQVPADFTPGKEATVFNLTNAAVKVAPLICFEDTLGELTRRFVLRGANLLANVTNDGWFLRSAGSQQHLANAVFRCVETRRPMARAANTGVTCFVNRFGRVTQVLRDSEGSQFTEGVLTGEVAVPTDGQMTFYVRHGELFAKICGGVALLFLLTQLPRLVRRKAR
ncbi:MAG: apolipoprotein N-acyltransferase [Verrucomicrobiota bacterium]|nr:apolipoprotein N-acyltransferase [Chthoniobacterales bacterium]MDQ3413969.1 apolipoprotein N-acyltransferase [Verrucomicrobiota bacterium]